MYPQMSYVVLQVLIDERIREGEVVYQEHRPIVRAIAHSLGQTLQSVGNRLEHFGR